jgi:hypothetical protein
MYKHNPLHSILLSYFHVYFLFHYSLMFYNIH